MEPVATTPAKPRPVTFYGQYVHKITERNQVSIPSPMLKALKANDEGQLLLVWWNNEPSLRMLTQDRFWAKMEEIKARPGFPPQKAARMIRDLAAQAWAVDPDSQGRIVIKAEWATQLSIRNEVMFSGRFSYIEVAPVKAGAEGEAAQPPDPEWEALKQATTEVLDSQ